MSVTLTTLITRVRQASDMEDTDFVTDTEITTYINAAGAELHDLLVGVFEDYLTLSGSFTATTTNNLVQMPDNMLKLRTVEKNVGSGTTKMDPFNLSERARYTYGSAFSSGYYGIPVPAYMLIGQTLELQPAQSASGTYTYYYVTTWNDLVSGSSPNSIAAPYTNNHWEEYLVVDAAIRCKQKEESDVSVLMSQKANLRERILTSAAKRDSSGRKQASLIEDGEYPNRWNW